jgi:hypothetical protein
MTNTNDLLKQGIVALKAGQKAEARRLLKQVVQQDKDNETAWLWLSGTMDTDHERIRCLRETLRINPNNEQARRGLEKLESKVPTSQSSLSQPQSQPTSIIKKFLNEEQDPAIVQQVYTKVSQILTKEEEILYIAVQNKPIVNIAPRCVVLTNRRFII